MQYFHCRTFLNVVTNYGFSSMPFDRSDIVKSLSLCPLFQFVCTPFPYSYYRKIVTPCEDKSLGFKSGSTVKVYD